MSWVYRVVLLRKLIDQRVNSTMSLEHYQEPVAQLLTYGEMSIIAGDSVPNVCRAIRLYR